ncbi:MAG TPA: glycosyltransferase family 2 protein [Candidatus Saccharimonadales bacterium]|nr:glycosyltransferase family 2 protein [Candidatus Saccharimonadales bacterium]
MKKLTVIVPCYNEEEGIGQVIAKLPRDKLQAYGCSLHVLVVDNNSKDKTAEVARAAGADVITETKQGKGHAVRRAFYSVPNDTDYVVMLDGDDTYNASEIWRLVEPIDSGFAKVIIGSRMHGNIREGSMKPLNRLGNRVYSRLVRTGYKVKVTDVLTGYYAWSREVIEALRPHLNAGDFTIEMEMMTKMARLGYDIYSVPISYDSRLGSSSLNPIIDGYRILKTYVRNLRWKPSRQLEIAGVFMPATEQQSAPFALATAIDKELFGESKAAEDSARL